MKFQKVSQGSDSEDETFDLSKPVHSLSHYVDNEEELVAQMFKALKFKKIKAMLPPVLRNAPVVDIQRLLVKELTGMSRTRLLASINGEEINTSSSDSDLSDSEFDMSSSNSEDDNKADPYPLKSAKKTVFGDLNPKAEGASNLLEENMAGLVKNDTSNLTALDIIELEMRAKLIKTMLEKQPGEEGDEALENLLNVKIKKEPMSPEFPAGIIKKEKMTPQNSPSHSDQSSSSDRGRRRRRRSNNSHSSKSRSLSRSSKSRSRSRSSKSRSRSSSRSLHDKKSRYRSSSGSSKGSSKKSLSRSSSSSSDDSAKKYSTGENKSKRKLTRKEFEERMKKAKMNRSYRKREDTDQESFDEEEDEIKRKKYKKWKARMQKKLDEKAAKWEKQYMEGMKKEMQIEKTDKEMKDIQASEEMEEGEVLEKEDGEIDSNEDNAEIPPEEEPILEEEEEGACSTSDGDQEATKKADHLPTDDQEKQTEEPIQIQSNQEREQISTYSEKGARRRTRRHKNRKSRRRETPDVYSDQQLQPHVNEDIQADNNDGIRPLAEDEPILSSANENSMTEVNMTLPCKSERQSISFSLQKKNLNVVKGSDGSDEDGETASFDEVQNNVRRHFSLNQNIEIVGEESDQEVESQNESEKWDENITKNHLSSKKTISLEETKNVVKERSPLLQELTRVGVSAENSCDSNVDIIGFIEPKGGRNDSDSFDEELIGGASWSSRWLQSDKVKTVVSDSKIMSKVRKNIQAKGKIEKPIVYSAPPQTMTRVELAPPTKPDTVIGSIEEYEKVVGVKIMKKPPAKKLPPGLESGDSEDSEEEALWSQIMKK